MQRQLKALSGALIWKMPTDKLPDDSRSLSSMIYQSLRETLQRSEQWPEVPTDKAGQPAFHQEGVDIRNYPELDVFGYNYWKHNLSLKLQRESLIRITETLKLRLPTDSSSPSVISSDSLNFLYASFVVDLHRLGRDTWTINKENSEAISFLQQRNDIECSSEQDDSIQCSFLLPDKQREQRLRAVLKVLHTGIINFGSSESNLKVWLPVFLLLLPLQEPLPVAELIRVRLNAQGLLEISGIRHALSNHWRYPLPSSGRDPWTGYLYAVQGHVATLDNTPMEKFSIPSTWSTTWRFKTFLGLEWGDCLHYFVSPLIKVLTPQKS